MRRVTFGLSSRPQWVVIVVATAMVSLGVFYSTHATALNQRAEAAELPLTVKTTSFAKITPLPVEAIDCKEVACVGLSFDDGPDATNTAGVLDVLNQKDVDATFFVIGYRVAALPQVVQRMYAEGNDVGNHSWDHKDFLKLTSAQMRQQIDQTQAAVINLGIPAPTLFRPPYGDHNAVTDKIVNMPIVMWNVDPKDWKETDPNRLVSNVVDPAGPGSLILMHCTYADTVAALPRIIDGLRAKGLTPVPVSKLISIPAGTQGVFAHE